MTIVEVKRPNFRSALIQEFLEDHLDTTVFLEAWGEWSREVVNLDCPSFSDVIGLSDDKLEQHRSINLTIDELEYIESVMVKMKVWEPEAFNLIKLKYVERYPIRKIAKLNKTRYQKTIRSLKAACCIFHNFLVRTWAREHNKESDWSQERVSIVTKL